MLAPGDGGTGTNPEPEIGPEVKLQRTDERTIIRDEEKQERFSRK